MGVEVEEVAWRSWWRTSAMCLRVSIPPGGKTSASGTSGAYTRSPAADATARHATSVQGTGTAMRCMPGVAMGRVASRAAGWVVVCRLVDPHRRLAQPVALARRGGVLVGGVDRVRLQRHGLAPLRELRDEVVVPAAEEREGQHAADHLAGARRALSAEQAVWTGGIHTKACAREVRAAAGGASSGRCRRAFLRKE